MALHSSYNSKGNFRIACGMPMIPFRTKVSGPITSFQFQQQDIIDEAFQFFRVNVLFKNYQIKGPADKVIIYLSVLISYLFKCTESCKDSKQANKRLGEIQAMHIPPPKDKTNFMQNVLQDGPGPQRNLYAEYIKQLRAETIKRFQEKFYKDNIVIEDFKFWSGLAKKRFMGMSYAMM